jgi:lysophosphatidylcholine acyltransferase/lyso-PAF acetyltransferase
MPAASHTARLYVSNHVSWADILVAMLLSSPSFIAKAGVQDVPVVGTIAASMDCLFVQRENGGEKSGASSLVRSRLAQLSAGATPPLWVFPEGTTTNGRFLLPFRVGAFLCGSVPLQPIVLLYNRDAAFSPAFESIEAPRSLFLTVSQHRPAKLTVLHLPLYTPSEAERADPGLFAANVREAMLKACPQLQSSQLGLSDKRDYHAALRRGRKKSD